MKVLLTSVMLTMLPTTVATAKSTIASYYGSESGSRTASGERFNPNGHTAAHKHLPFGTILCVEYKGRSVTVRINDRGPFVRGRGLDLSRGAARAIHMPGTARVTYHHGACHSQRQKGWFSND